MVIIVTIFQDNENALIVAARTGQVDIVQDLVNDFDLQETDAVCFSSFFWKN